MADFKIWSDSFEERGYFGRQQGYDDPAMGGNGQNISPRLFWSGVPAGAKSLALTVYDPDAPTGSGFWHWVVAGLPTNCTGLPEGAGNVGGDLPAGAVQFVNDYGKVGFGGFAPPAGDKPHRYIFRLHALTIDKLPIPKEATNAIARFIIYRNELDSTSITGLYEIKNEI